MNATCLILTTFLLAFFTMTAHAQTQLEVDGDVIINGKISGVTDPVDAQDAATKAYIDNLLLSFGISVGPSGVQGLLDLGISPLEILNNGASVSDFYGLTYQGGLIFYLDSSTGTGLVAAPSDQSTSAEWGCFEMEITGADGTAIGTGEQNTISIEIFCLEPGTAADLCANLTLGGYSDWFLPSLDEVDEIYTNLYLNGFGNLADGDDEEYWTSSEIDADIAWATSFEVDLQFTFLKTNKRFVRAVRAF